jgi:MFS family permease
VLGHLADSYRAAFRGLPREVWLLAAVALINRSGSMVLPFLSLYLTSQSGLSVASAGRVLAAYGLGSIAGSVVGGWLSDRIGATRTQLLSLGLGGAAFLAFPLLHSRGSIAAGSFVLSLIVDTLRPAVMADMAHRAPPALAARSFALLRLAVNLGLGVGPAVGGFLALVGYGWLFVADGLTCWLAAIVLACTLGRAPVAPRVDDASADPGRSPWRDGPFLALMLLVTLIACAFFQVFGTLPLYLQRECGLGESAIGLRLALNAALIVAFEMVLIHRLAGWNPLPLVGVGALLVCTGLGLLPFGSTIPFVALTIVVWTVGEMLSLPLTNAIVAERAGPRQRGRYMGLYTMAYSVAFVVAPSAGTWIYERFGPTALWRGIGVMGIVLLGWALALVPAFRERRTAA